jgi:hypothetical protein
VGAKAAPLDLDPNKKARNMANAQKRMEYKPVNNFDVNEIAPDAPEGEWKATIPRGKCKVQPTREEKLPMIIVPIRLESTDESGEEFEKALGTELSVFLVFGGRTAQGERMAKRRIKEVCEAADVDTDVIPKKITDPPNDLDPFIRALEGKKLTVWTRVQTRKDTGEDTTEILFRDPNQALRRADQDDDDEGDNEATPARGRKKAASRSNGRRR